MEAYAAHVGVMSKGERTRQSIIESAAPLFNQRGFEGCSMADIMQATGLEKGCIYRHFESKEELAAEVFSYSWQKVFNARGVYTQQGDAIAKLKGLVACFVEIPSPLPGGCPLLNTAIDADDGNAKLRELVHDALSQWKKRVRLIVKQGITAGEISPQTDPLAIANVLIGLLEGTLMITRLERNRRALKDAQQMLNTMIDGMSVSRSQLHSPHAPTAVSS